MTKSRPSLVAFITILSTEAAVPKTVGVVGITDDAEPREALTSLLEDAGHTVSFRGKNLNFDGLDVVILIQATGRGFRASTTPG